MENIAQHQWENLKERLEWNGSETAFLAGLRMIAWPTYYPKLCAWCEAEGVRTVTGWTTCERSSGICPEHLSQLNAECEARHAQKSQARQAV